MCSSPVCQFSSLSSLTPGSSIAILEKCASGGRAVLNYLSTLKSRERSPGLRIDIWALCMMQNVAQSGP